MKPHHRAGAFALRAIGALPSNLQVRVAGGDPLRRGAAALHPEMQLLLKLSNLVLMTAEGVTVDEFRWRQREGALAAGGPPIELGAVRDLYVGGAVGQLRARHYAPVDGDGAPLLVYFHGGGFVFGDLDTHDAPCRFLCRHGGFHVLSVDYRLAPEHPFPAAIEDAVAALTWAQAHAASLGADGSRVGVGGDSAGGNISAVVSHLAVREGRTPPSCQVLLYPVVDVKGWHPSRDEFARGFLLEAKMISWFNSQYIGAASDGRDPKVSPLKFTDFSGLPPALIVTAAFDPLRDEGELYAAALSAAGTPALLRRFDGLVHGFANLVGASGACRHALIETAGAARALFAFAPRMRRVAAASIAAAGATAR